ncbi:MAG: sensor histidine kinase [Leptolyngbya sp. DLM2.Bin27]|nr:MAG: sensor histidine kinase [Leptolyngbya sp. DLM2.Bin27]
MSNQTSEHLKQRSQEIIEMWEARVRAEIAASNHQESLVLRNSLPKYINHLADSLSNQSERTSDQIEMTRLQSTQVSLEHGQERAGYADYSLPQLIFEYRILRQIIFQVLEAEAPLEPKERDLIVDSLEQAVSDAATQFSQTLQDIQELFMVTLTHDLRSPLNTIKMGAQLTLNQFKPGDRQSEIVAKMLGAADRLNAMIQNLLDVSRLRAGHCLSVDLEACNLASLVNNIVEDLTLTYGDRFVVCSEADVWSRCSPGEMRRVIENLATNAVKYGAPATPITFVLQQTDTHVSLAVHNHGEPIDPSAQSILFQQFRRSTDTEDQSGWGLGLFLAKNIVEAHGGTITVSSEAGKGTSFVVKLPKDP